MYNHFGRLTQEAFELDAMLEELEGDVSDQIIQDWITRHEKNEKLLINAACGVIQEYQIADRIYQEELERLEARRKNYSSKIASIKTMLMNYQIKLGKKSVDTGLFVTTVVGNGGVRPMTIPEHIEKTPEEQLTFIVKERLEIDKKKIYKFLETAVVGDIFTEKAIEDSVFLLIVEINEFEELELIEYRYPNDGYIDAKNKTCDPISRELIATLKPRGTHLRIA